ncbi:hypothetical protein RSOLAG22IIIB_08253 [Rhizoctonia solani]|uniref:Uncharacterized protein n=1 Tax=Rhizoctonia solani TaxID=456999 RepID=A0A0K6FRY7_9AGAM|nr:hypothetical protein RSOLAG22IIIB_08253 [Rhizoctonia solani]
MDANPTCAKFPRKLVLAFPVPPDYMIETDEGIRPQKIDYWCYIERRSRLVQFAARLGLTKENESLMIAIEQAYTFIYSNYKSEDQVILYFYLTEMDLDRDLKAAEILIKHLQNGTRPGNSSGSQTISGSNVPPTRIPIHGIVAMVNREARGMCEVNDELKSRFPLGIEHIICGTYDQGFRSCATRLDMTGRVLSREVFIAEGDSDSELWRHCTKHVLYWEEDWIPKWDQHDPVWTQQLDSTSGDGSGGPSLELTKPFGMYLHELRKYERLPNVKEGRLLVWKSCRGVDRSNA